MDEVRLANYLAGTDLGPIEAYRTDHLLSRYLGVKRGAIIWLSNYNLTKIRIGHPDVNYGHYIQLPKIFSGGFVCIGKQARSLEICHFDWPIQKALLVCIKATATHEVYVTTLHPVDRKEARRRYRKAIKTGKIIRRLDTASETELLRVQRNA